MVAGSWPSGNRGKSVHKRILGMVYVHIGRWMCTWMRYDVGISAWMRNLKHGNDGIIIPMVKEMLPESMVNKQEHFIYCSFFPSSITSFAPRHPALLSSFAAISLVYPRYPIPLRNGISFSPILLPIPPRKSPQNPSHYSQELCHSTPATPINATSDILVTYATPST